MKEKLQIFTKETIELLKNSKNIIITTHTNPDGDAIGSSLAFYHVLKSNFKNSTINIFTDSKTPDNLNFLNGSDIITIFNKKCKKIISESDLIIVLDLNNSKRVKSMQESILNSKAKKIMIDHHIDPENFTDFQFVDTEATSTGEILKKYYNAAQLAIPKEAAEGLYVAIMTDTGNFRHNRTNSETFRIAADLIDLGANPVELYDKVYNQNNLSGLKLLGYALNNIELFYNDKISIISIPEEIIKKYKASKGDIEGFAEKTLSVKNAVIGILLVKFPDRNEVKISLRSKSNYSVRDIAVKFDGGGHLNAAGARIENKSIEEARDILIKEIKDTIEF